MILYHGSHTVIKTPDVSLSRNNLDFGKGFYTTPVRKHAEKWSEHYIKNNGTGAVSWYEFDEGALNDDLNILFFDSYSEEWLDFIVSCRTGKDTGNYDIVIGGIANDKVFNTLTLLFRGYYEKSDAIKRLKYKEPSIQYCFRTQSVLDKYLQFISGEVIL